MKTDLAIEVASISALSGRKSDELRKLWVHGVQADTNAVGWLPTSVFDSRANTDEISAVYRDGDLVGWCLRGESKTRKVLKIYQIWVRPDARVLEHGKALIDQIAAVARRINSWYLEAWVAEDLEANVFWAAIGFTRTTWRWGRGGSLRKIYRWVKTAEELPHWAAKGGEFVAVENYV